MNRPALILASLLALGSSPNAQADEFRQAADNARVDCTASKRELTRIALIGDQFASVSKISSGYPYSDFAVSNEPVRGDIYLSVPETFAADRLSFFATTKKGYVYKFACSIAAIDAQQVFVTNPALSTGEASAWEQQTAPQMSAVRLIQAMATQGVVEGFTVRQSSNAAVRVGEIELQLIAEYRGAALLGKTIRLANRGDKPIALSEADFAPKDALAVSLGASSLAPGAATSALVVTTNPGAQP